jgi:TonB family protein
METVVPTPVEPELNLLTQWHDPADSGRRRRAAIATVMVHIVAISILFLLPESFFEEKHLPEPIRRITPIIFEPLTKLTQKAPNPSKVVKEFSASEARERPHPPAPPPAPPAPKQTPPRQAVIPQAPPPKPAQTLPEPPKVETAVNAPKIDVSQLGTVPPPPKIQAQESPRLPLENLSQGPPPVLPPDKRIVTVPDASPTAIVKDLGGGIPQAQVPLPGTDSEPSALQLPQLISDAQGVDFAPYLRVILQTVKRNWQSVMPEAVHLGRTGKVSIVFSVGREGQVIKMVISTTSGIDSFDKAAVAGISMSNPFPPLPSAFKGDHIAVQFNFAYNTPKKK